MRRLILFLATSAVLLGCGGSDQSAAPRDKPFDGMVDVGDHQLHLSCDGSGEPTVILESGLTGDHRTWDEVIPLVAKTTRVCTYDRANIDPSESAPTPRTARDMVTDLHALIDAGHLEPPYVLVGFSFGGLVTQLYASTHPEDVGGLVLVESNHPDEVDQFEAELTKAQIAADRREAEANPEGVDLYASFEQVQDAPDLPTRPLVIVTSGKPGDWPPGWDAAVFDRLRASEQKDLATLVPGGRQIFAKRSGHDVPLSEPKVVVTAIAMVLDEIG